MTPAPNPSTSLENALVDALPRLHRKVRRPAVERLASRIAGAQPATSVRPAALIRALVAALKGIHAEVAEVEALFARLTREWQAATDEPARRAVILAHLEETVPDRKERRRDVRAMRRWLGVDALRERLERRRQRLLVEEETALYAIRGIASAAPEEAKERIAKDAATTAAALLARSLEDVRLQNRVAALEALAAVCRAVPASLAGDAEAAAKLASLSDQPAASPWLQAAALDALLVADAASGRVLLRRRLVHPEAAPRDFLFRRHALDLAARHLAGAPETLLALLDDAASSDPSEYVRIGICELASPLLPRGAEVLRKLARDPAPKVRASAALAAASAVERGGEAAGCGLDVLAGALARDEDPLVLRLGCELVARLSDALIDPSWAERRTSLAGALGALAVREGVPGAVLEAAAAARQALARASDPARRAWTAHLGAVLSRLRVGERTRVPLSPPPAGLSPLPEDDAWLGAILADLAREDYGVYARRDGRELTIWRGDRFAHRAWRVLHEVSRPAPNKRQGHRHSIGRVVEGELRAHPARMDEITATTVPGERVHVASEGGWGRHLPTVDDLLDLPLRSETPVRVFSSHGVTTVTPPVSWSKRLENRLRLTRDYDRFAGLRLSSLRGEEGRDRKRFVEEVDRELGVRMHFAPWEDAAMPPALRSLFGAGSEERHQFPLAEASFVASLTDYLLERNEYFQGAQGNGVLELAVFTAALFSVFLVDAYRKREAVRRARAELPLCIGGWGTRGKSGTERLKAALFGGLGFEVFAKTTGSEAMFVHFAPGGDPTEFFIFRPYDKATIWEQKDMAELASRLGVEVFLWECMALQPGFVDLLQNDWMRDDYATLTNAYPDHEDVQGPAGMDVAEVITRFMPEGSTVITTEDHFLPLFRETARARSTTLLHSPWWEAELIPEEVLDLFPYREHPRNMALVATLGEQLGIPRPLALGLMAEHVQPEIGVLKVFPRSRVRGRVLTFINGHSANERTGFLNNWRRTGLDRIDPELDGDRAVVTVINNRWDRVARSEVFARILVEDAPADRHVLIGTNLEGLQKYVRGALDAHLARAVVVAPEDLTAGSEGQKRAEERLARQLAFLRIPRPKAATFIDRVQRYARGAGLSLEPGSLIEEVEEALAATSEDLHVSRVREHLDRELGPAIERALQSSAAPEDPATPEVLAPATAKDVRSHALFLLSRLVVHARLRRMLPRQGEAAEEIATFHRRFAAAYRELLLEQFVTVPDSRATGDQIIDACARAVPPGLEVSVIGAQNIKGTGLDWVYRWQAVDKISSALASLENGGQDERRRALEVLETFEDNGFVDAGLARAKLPLLAAEAASPDEAARLQRLVARFDAIHERKVAALDAKREGSAAERLLRGVEHVFDYLDSVRRRRIAEQLVEDLVNGRVSHARAAVETRRLYERQKGGWLVNVFIKPEAQVPAVTPAYLPVPAPAAREAFDAALHAPHDARVQLPVDGGAGKPRNAAENKNEAAPDERDPA